MTASATRYVAASPQPGDALSLGAVHLFEVELVTAQIDDSRDAVQQWLGRCDITTLK